MIRLLSYNVHFGRKSKKFFPWLSAQKTVDIMCLQEFPERKIDEFMSLHKKYSYAFSPTMKIFKHMYGNLTMWNNKKLTLTHADRITLGKRRMNIRTEFNKSFSIINVHSRGLRPIKKDTRKFYRFLKR